MEPYDREQVRSRTILGDPNEEVLTAFCHMAGQAVRVLVTGGRDFTNAEVVDRALSRMNPSVVIHGDARGADTLCHEWAEKHQIPVETYPADWDTYGKRAGRVRNVVMLNNSKPTVVLAFPGGKGTNHMVEVSRKREVPVYPGILVGSPRIEHFRVYDRGTSAHFRYTSGIYGVFSNFSSHPVIVAGKSIATTEHLYQMMKFGSEQLQEYVVSAPTPKAAKSRAREHPKHLMRDWDKVRVQIMRWCLRLKYTTNHEAVVKAFDMSQDQPIVEESTRDSFWGAIPSPNDKLIGENVLGRLWMELREEHRAGQVRDWTPRGLLFLGAPIT